MNPRAQRAHQPDLRPDPLDDPRHDPPTDFEVDYFTDLGYIVFDAALGEPGLETAS